MRIKYSDLPKELFPTSKKIAGLEFFLQRCSIYGGQTYLKSTKYRGWGYSGGGATHVQFTDKDRYVEYILKNRYLQPNTITNLQSAISGLEISHIIVQPRYDIVNVKNLDAASWDIQARGAHVTLWVRIPLTEKQSRAVDNAVEAEKERKATEKAKKKAAEKAEKDRKAAAQAAREREAKLAEAQKVGKTTVTDVAEALMILQKAGLKVVTIEEKK